MRCEDARQRLYPFIDGELDVAENLQVLGHLNVCPACGAVFEAEKRLKELIREKGTAEAASPALRERCHHALVREDRSRWVRRWAVAAAVLAAIALPVLYLTRPAAPPDVPPAPRMISDIVRVHKGVLAGDSAILGAKPVRGNVEAIQAYFKENLGMPACLHDLGALGYRMDGGAVCRLEGPRGGRAAWITESRDEPGGRRRLLTQGAMQIADAQRIFTGGERFQIDTRDFRRYHQEGYDVLVSYHPWGSCVFVFQAESSGEVMQLAQAIR